MSNAISQDFKPLSFLRFTLPSMIMMMFMSIYIVVDGVFVSQFIGSNALSSINIVWPVICILNAIAIMLATGGSAVISTKFGEGKARIARENFTSFVVFGAFISLFLLVLTLLFLNPLCHFLGANEILLSDCRTYLKFLIIFAPACMLQILFQSYFVSAGKPRIGLTLTIIGGLANAFLDYFFMGVIGMGIEGAAIATGIGQLIPAGFGLIYFALRRSDLYFVRFHFNWTAIRNACLNGSSEMVSNLANAIVTYLFNYILLRLAGEDGVAAITIILYGQFLFSALYQGFTIGAAPVISYNHGAGNHKGLQTIYRICMTFILLASLLMTAGSFLFARPIAGIFVTPGSNTFMLTCEGFALFSFSYLFSGLNIFSSGMFTALSDGKTSAILSFSRTFVCIIAALMILPKLFGITGVWLAVPVAEFVTLFLSLYYHLRKADSYHYRISHS